MSLLNFHFPLLKFVFVGVATLSIGHISPADEAPKTKPSAIKKGTLTRSKIIAKPDRTGKITLKPGVGSINGPLIVKPLERKVVGQRFLVTGSWYVTNADDGSNGPFERDIKVEVKGDLRFDGQVVHSRTERQPSVIKTAGSSFPSAPYIVDYYYDRPGSKMLRVSGEYVDHDKASGNDLMWRHDEQIDLNQVLQEGRGAQGSVRSGEKVLSGDNNSESLDITIKVTAGEMLYK